MKNKIAASVLIAACAMTLTTGCITKVEETPSSSAGSDTAAGSGSSASSESAGGTAGAAGDSTESSAAAAAFSSGTEAAGTEAGASSSSASAVSAQATSAKGSGKVVVYNWGEYMDPDVITQFEEETGIQVVYDEYETNEIMYPKVAAGAASYDLICPSDYMIAKMIENDMLQPINFDHIPNYTNIDEEYITKSQGFDPENRYSIPYCWGTVGILYNTTMVDDTVDSWDILWDEKYKDNILMQDSVRDAFMVAEKLLGYDINTTDEDEVKAAADKLIEQKPLVQAYVIDQVRDKMIGGEAALGVIYSGEAIYTKRENPDLEYVIPKEGTNVWIDSWVIPKDAKNVENAEKFLDFLCRGDIAAKNFEYITYSTPNKAARELITDEDIKNSTVAFPTSDMLENSEVYTYIGEDGDALYAKYWDKVKSS